MSDLNTIKEKIRPILEQLTYQLVMDKPKNPALHMIECLQKIGGYTNNGITLEEKKELENLRHEVKKFREMEETNESENVHCNSESDNEDEDDVDPSLEEKVINAKARLSRQREAVSAEAYGEYNKKQQYKAKVIAKNNNQIQRIKARVLQSFVFTALEGKSIDIVIDSMEEKAIRAGETVIKEGDDGDCLYIIETGELDCYKILVIY